ncbi:MAG: DUF4405 domain-containing protein [Chlorobi bacterium]|nr:DUF4405 domain-containing protein [Chlorobiota bacterium]
MPDIRNLLITVLLLFIGCPKTNAQTNEDCMMCHEDKDLKTERYGKTISVYVNSAALLNSVHKELKCIACHDDLEGSDFPHDKNLKKVDCGSCHAGYAEQVKNDIHFVLMKYSCDNKPSCKTCHNTHNIKKPSKVKNKSKEFCGKCHEKNVLSASYHTNKEINNSCKECHKEKAYAGELKKSVHEKLTCANCHGFAADNLSLHQKGNPKNKTADCYVCHNKEAEEHKESIHGVSLEKGIDDAAKCWDCHGSHAILKVSSDSSSANPENLVKTCGKCHDNSDFAEKHLLSVKNPCRLYSSSVHNKLLKAGNKNAPSCINCHGVHNIKNRLQENSSISSFRVSHTCAKCHKKEAYEYERSIHYIAVKKGIREAPTCNDCHSEHAVMPVDSAGREAAKKIQDNTCLVCHENLILAERYGMQENNVSAYKDSYHGLASSFGNNKAAMCVDCHGIHKILPAYSDESSINPENLTNTCKKCHPEATDVFARSYSHVSVNKDSAKLIETIVRIIYLWLIIVVIGGMIIHNVIIFVHDLKEKRNKEKKQIRITRFTANELLQHLFLLVSFIFLAVSGFLLKYSQSPVADALRYMGFDEHTRRIVHRVAASVMFSVSLYHVVYLIATHRGRSLLRALLPKPGDLKTAGQNIMYYLGIRKKHPDFENFNYIEKAEYWALIWGAVVMGLTGFFLWFPTLVGDWAPVWLIKVSEIIHFFEAILATLAIIVWHWFFVMFRPKEYPLNFACVDGLMTLETYKEEHKLTFKKVVAEWVKLKTGKKKRMSDFTERFINAVKKNGIDPDMFFVNEIKNDDELKKYLKENNIEYNSLIK